ncbi:hypothetical protein JOF35_005229 [Streptomyces demainii]|uniref:Uncharacterized protein n=1 Tax=Streptomyces demainii TaxID=588122 RepID=A0ABT9KZP7_9ACTN|nr:hypothetical protein [Streptomyces demainii]MDP9612952.1 hypothetical protein [Streptomyces demainii]
MDGVVVGAGCNEVGDQAPFAVRPLYRARAGVGHTRYLPQGGGDLGEHDQVAGDLDLVVGAAVEMQQPFGSAADAVAGAVVTLPVHGNEPLAGQIGHAEIAAGESRAGGVQLADGAVGHGPSMLVADKDGGARDGPADRTGRSEAARTVWTVVKVVFSVGP